MSDYEPTKPIRCAHCLNDRTPNRVGVIMVSEGDQEAIRGLYQCQACDGRFITLEEELGDAEYVANL